MKDKYEFIVELLETNKLTPAQKERVMILSANAIKDSSKNDDDIIKRIEKIEAEIRGNKESDPPKPAEERIYVNKHTPQEMVKFLHLFSKSEDFKWFTHNDCPLPFDYNSRISIAKKLLPESPKISINFLTYSNVRNFLFEVKNKDGKRFPCWDNSNKIIKYTWVDVKDWCINHPKEDPFNAEITNDAFLPYINSFKNVIEFRTDVDNLTFLKRLKQFIKQNLYFDLKPIYTDNFKINANSLNVYIDTNLFFKGLKQIIDWINVNKSKSNEIEINLESNNDNYYQLEFFHKNSYFSLSPNNPKMKGTQGDFDKTRKNLFCVADWIIQAEFQYENKREYYNILCLDNNTFINTTKNNQELSENVFEKLDEQIGGVKHILKLYKTV